MQSPRKQFFGLTEMRGYQRIDRIAKGGVLKNPGGFSTSMGPPYPGAVLKNPLCFSTTSRGVKDSEASSGWPDRLPVGSRSDKNLFAGPLT